MEPERILIVRTDRIGDVVLATPLIRALRATFPRTGLAALVRPYTRDVLLHNPHLDEILIDDSEGEHRGTLGFWRQVGAIRRKRFDTALLLLPTMRLAWMMFFAGIRTRIGVGRRVYQTLTFMQHVSRNGYIPLRHESDYCLDLGRTLGVEGSDFPVEVFVAEEERQAAWNVLQERAGGELTGRALVGIHPGSGKSAPNWRPERYADLAELLLRDPSVTLVVTGGPGEEEIAEPLRRIGSGRILDLAGRQTVREVIGTLSHLRVLVSASTGTMHLAAGLRVPTVSLFCPLTACSPLLWGPRGNDSDVILPPEMYCERRCPGEPKKCDLEGGVLPEDVAERVRSCLRI